MDEAWHEAGSDDPSELLFPGSFVDPAMARVAARTAQRVARRIVNRSGVYDADADADLPYFARCEILLGDMLGRGGFNDVYEVRSIWLLSQGSDDSLTSKGTDHTSEMSVSNDDGEEGGGGVGGGGKGNGNGNAREHALGPIDLAKRDSQRSRPFYRRYLTDSPSSYRKRDDAEIRRSFLAEHCLRPNTGDARYAVKHLSSGTLFDAKSYKTGAADLAVEAKLLSSLSHPNLIKIRGLSAGGFSGFASGTPDGFFLILDRLYGTLDDKIVQWREKQRRLSAFLRRKIFDKSGKKKRAFLAERMRVALDVAAALAYMHSHNIVYRDLKPDNIGFDIRGDVKIFDLGLAKELHPMFALKDGTYRLSGNTGSLRYMAPEVALHRPYNLTADVYSFSLLLWEMCALYQPYDGMGRCLHADTVVRGTHRPPVDPAWPSRTKCAMEKGWHPSIRQRPDMNAFYCILREDIALLRGGDEDGLGEADPRAGAERRRSTFVLQPLSSHGGGGGGLKKIDVDGGTECSVEQAAAAAAAAVRPRMVTRGATAA